MQNRAHGQTQDARPNENAHESTNASPIEGPKLSLLDASCIIVGTIIGAGIFKLAPDVAANAGSFTNTIIVWIAGGLMAISGAVCFAELATRFPNQVGGDYIYLKSAYGKTIAFMFAWAAFWIIRPGNICVMALVFAEYFSQACALPPPWSVWVAVSVIIALSGVNLAGLAPGSKTQNILTMAKIVGITCVIALPFTTAITTGWSLDTPLSGSTGEIIDSASPPGSWRLAIVFVMFTLGGWNDIALVAGEIKNPRINLYKSLVIGTVSVTVIYLIFNVALYYGLGYAELASSKNIAADLTAAVAGRAHNPAWANLLQTYGAQFISVLVCLSCLGAINGMILTSPRIYYSVGRDYPVFEFLARWNRNRSVPWHAITAQAIVTSALTLMTLGRADGVEEMVTATTPYFFGFFALTTTTLFVFRRRDRKSKANLNSPLNSPLNLPSNSTEPSTLRPATDTVMDGVQKVPLYPLPPLLFLCVCGLMCYSAIDYVIFRQLTALSLVLGGLLAAGAVIAIALPHPPKNAP